MLGLQGFQFFTEVAAHLPDVAHQAIHGPQKFDGDGAGQRTSAKGGSMHAGMHSAGHPVGGQDGAKRQTGSQRLGYGDDVRLHSVVLIGEVFSRAAQTALDLVDDQQGAGTLGQFPCRPQELRADGIDAAFSLDRLQTHGAHAAIELPLQVVDVIEGDEPDAGQQRRKGMTILCLPGRGQRTKGAAVEGIFQSQNAPLRLVAVRVLSAGQGTGELERSFPGFGAAVAEKCLVQAGNLGQPFGQFRLVLVIEQVGYVNQPARLALEHSLDRGVCVPERIDPQPAQEIEVAFPFRVPEVDAPSPSKENALAIIGWQQ